MTTMAAPPRLGQGEFVGVDTHKSTHHVAVIDADGRLVADRQFATTAGGNQAVAAWLGQWAIQRVGIEQSGTYGAGLTLLLRRAGHDVIDVNAPDLVVRASSGKSDPIDAAMAAEAVRTGRASARAKDRSAIIESIRLLHTARASAVKARTAALSQIGDLAITVPADLRERLGTGNRQIARGSLTLRPDQTRLSEPAQAAKSALRSIAVRIRDLDEEITALDASLGALVTQAAPRLLERPQVGIQTAAQLLITNGQDSERVTSDAKFARLIGVAPIPASSGQTRRMRLHRGGDRQANKAVHMVAVGRLANHQPAIDYLHRRRNEGLSKKDAIRAMKRLITRELYGALKADLRALDGL